MSNGAKFLIGFIILVPISIGVLSFVYNASPDFRSDVDGLINKGKGQTSQASSEQPEASSSGSPAVSSSAGGSSSNSSSSPAGSVVSSSQGEETISIFYSGSNAFKLEGEKQTFYAELNNATTADEYMTVESSDAAAVSLSTATCKADDVITATCMKSFAGNVTVTFAKENDATIKNTLTFTFTTAALGKVTQDSGRVAASEGIVYEMWPSDGADDPGWKDWGLLGKSLQKENASFGVYDGMICWAGSNAFASYADTAANPVVAWPASFGWTITSSGGNDWTTDLTGLPEFDANGVGAVDFTKLRLSGNYVLDPAANAEAINNSYVKATLTKNIDYSYTFRLYLSLTLFNKVNAVQKQYWNSDASCFYYFWSPDSVGSTIPDDFHITQDGTNITCSARMALIDDAAYKITMLNKFGPVYALGTFYGSRDRRWHKKMTDTLAADDWYYSVN